MVNINGIFIIVLPILLNILINYFKQREKFDYYFYGLREDNQSRTLDKIILYICILTCAFLMSYFPIVFSNEPERLTGLLISYTFIVIILIVVLKNFLKLSYKINTFIDTISGLLFSVSIIFALILFSIHNKGIISITSLVVFKEILPMSELTLIIGIVEACVTFSMLNIIRTANRTLTKLIIELSIHTSIYVTLEDRSIIECHKVYRYKDKYLLKQKIKNNDKEFYVTTYLRIDDVLSVEVIRLLS